MPCINGRTCLQLRGYDSMVQRKSAWLDSQKTVLLQRLDQKRQKLEAELAALSKTALALEVRCVG